MKKLLSLFIAFTMVMTLTSSNFKNDTKPSLQEKVLELAKEIEPKVVNW